MRWRSAVACAALLVASHASDARSQRINEFGERVTTYPANAGAWPLLVGTTTVGVWNLIQAPMGRSRMWSVAGLGLGLAATSYGKITLDNRTSTADLAMGTMTAGVLTSAVAAISLLPRDPGPSVGDLDRVQRGALIGVSAVATIAGAGNAALNWHGDDRGKGAATIGIGLTSMVVGLGGRAQSANHRTAVSLAVLAGTVAAATGTVTFARHALPTRGRAFDCTTGSVCTRRVPLGRIPF